MKGSLRYRIILALLVGVLGLVYVLPSFIAQDSPLRGTLPDDEISLGLDLKGGVHLTLGVDIPEAIEYNLNQMGQDIRTTARDEGIAVLKPSVRGKDKLNFTLLKSDQRAKLDGLLNKHFNMLKVKARENISDGKVRYTLVMTPEYKREVSKLTVDQVLKTIRTRIDQFGVAEPDIRRQQGGRIQVQLPGLDDPQRAISVIGRTARLEFKIVDDAADLTKAKQGILAPGRELSTLKHYRMDGTYSTEPIVLHKDTVLSGEYITDAHVSYDNFGQPMISMNFNSRGARIFSRVTGENIGKRLAIVLDGEVYSAPSIKDKIPGGRASITGSFSDSEAADLALVLRSGSLPASVHVMEERTVGPSLGQESIDKGVTAALAGFAVVLLFMAVYYGFGGIVADTALVMNIVLIMAGLAGFGATLTLPGIAGIILTIGMAVDANVIIFERIREELRRGLTARAAIEEGYAKATLTILDANVTTVLAAIILYQFGTGPIRGFAVTLTLGILASMFTAIFVTRILFDMWAAKAKTGARLSI